MGCTVYSFHSSRSRRRFSFGNVRAATPAAHTGRRQHHSCSPSRRVFRRGQNRASGLQGGDFSAADTRLGVCTAAAAVPGAGRAAAGRCRGQEPGHRARRDGDAAGGGARAAAAGGAGTRAAARLSALCPAAASGPGGPAAAGTGPSWHSGTANGGANAGTAARKQSAPIGAVFGCYTPSRLDDCGTEPVFLPLMFQAQEAAKRRKELEQESKEVQLSCAEEAHDRQFKVGF